MHDGPNPPDLPGPGYKDTGLAPKSRWRMLFVVSTSAVLSGIAVVLWNRHTLAQFREIQTDAPAEPESEREFI